MTTDDRRSLAAPDDPPAADENDAHGIAVELLVERGAMRHDARRLAAHLLAGLAVRGFAVVRMEDRQAWANLAIRGVVHQDALRRLHAAETAQRRLTFDDVARVGRERSLAWHPGGLEEWSVADWAVAMAGEAGEICNAVKKLRRVETGARQASGPQTREAALAAIATEIGDTYLYLDLLAQVLGLRMADCVVDTFNRVSLREGLPQRLERERTIEAAP